MRKSDFTEEDIEKAMYGRSKPEIVVSEEENVIKAEERMYKKSNNENSPSYTMSDIQRNAYRISDKTIAELLEILLKNVNMFEAQYIISHSITDYFLDRLIGFSEGDIDLLNPDNNK